VSRRELVEGNRVTGDFDHHARGVLRTDPAS
jgi:hypothetical protein